ncbi:hypothetical protein LWI29_021914 [Acer saccharum]|uniref:Uncharacterized protein n=1 Tax=Acer saccharum TaxID=4024 RepID=A0AA39V920_ACESA|nr:hypothetical protein LWI29_021914 [Acer saccharum]
MTDVNETAKLNGLTNPNLNLAGNVKFIPGLGKKDKTLLFGLVSSIEPYQVLAKEGREAYRFQFFPSSQALPVLHVSQLKTEKESQFLVFADLARKFVDQHKRVEVQNLTTAINSIWERRHGEEKGTMSPGADRHRTGPEIQLLVFLVVDKARKWVQLRICDLLQLLVTLTVFSRHFQVFFVEDNEALEKKGMPGLGNPGKIKEKGIWAIRDSRLLLVDFEEREGDLGEMLR